MSIGMLILLVIGVILVTIKRRITRMYDMLDDKISSFSSLIDNFESGVGIAGKAVQKVKDAFTKQTSEDK